MTRGCIAIGQLEQWQGILIPCDAQPDKTGVELRNYLRYNKDLFAFAENLLSHPTWTSFRAKYIGGPNPFLGVENNLITNHNVNPMYIEYVYVINPATKDLHRLCATLVEGVYMLRHADSIDLITDDPPLNALRPKDVLSLRFHQGEPGYKQGVTIRDYLTKLLLTLWEEQESFDSKRPFGNSGWDFDVYTVLIRNGAVRGKLDSYGHIEDLDTAAALELVKSAINTLLKGE